MGLMTLLKTSARSPVAGNMKLAAQRVSSPASPLTDGLVAYYRMDDPSGTRWDWLSRGSGQTALIVRANNQRLTRADTAALRPGGTSKDICFAVWVYFETLGTQQGIFGKSGASRGFFLNKQSTDRLRFQVSADGTGSTNTAFDTTFTMAAQTWYFVVCWYDTTLNTLNVQVNNGTVQSQSYTAGIFASTATLECGRTAADSASVLDGRLGPIGYWISNTGGGAVLTAAQRTALYNNGIPRLYRTLQPDETAALAAYWELNEFTTSAVAVTRADSHTGGFTLTEAVTSGHVASATGIGNSLSSVNGVTATAGKIGNASVYTIASSQQLNGGDLTDLRSSDTDWSWAGWVYLAAKATTQTIISKDTASAGQREYRLEYVTGTDRFVWTVYDGTNVIGTVTANTFGSPTAATFYFVHVYHDATNNLVGISINAGAADTAATSGAASSGTVALFRFGANGSGTPNYLGGRLDEWARYRRVLSAGNVTSLYNAGSGRAYPY